MKPECRMKCKRKKTELTLDFRNKMVRKARAISPGYTQTQKNIEKETTLASEMQVNARKQQTVSQNHPSIKLYSSNSTSKRE